MSAPRDHLWRKEMTLRIRGRDIGSKEGKALLERGVDAETARAALKAAQASAQAKEWTLRSAATSEPSINSPKRSPY